MLRFWVCLNNQTVKPLSPSENGNAGCRQKATICLLGIDGSDLRNRTNAISARKQILKARW